MSTLSIIGTPIGNLEDVTIRALKVLGSSDLVLCEDTRMTKRLFDRHGISVPTKSYHMHSKISRTDEIIDLLKNGTTEKGKNEIRISLVSDAGTPGISDPGSELVSRIRKECAAEISAGELKIEAIPGPSALTSALSIAGVPCADFTFLGFLPHKKGRETLFKEVAASERTMVFYESPHRILKTLDSLVEHLGSAGVAKKVTICRELTKIFEEVVAGTAQDVKVYFEAHADKVRGEFVVIVSGE
ncbi:MAG TPA: 16S rRNA (cytidine(1402)-2'-O)-methyltransferase [Candidatus Paceibacterota bacterium]|jgi:16S rRNA (cytidine1402-2'-O)-methyltransferase|nr:16S rRNA (cytidine(1402)-2'-O)-methyltransferase [Candidatus Paceibacterota bacterium]